MKVNRFSRLFEEEAAPQRRNETRSLASFAVCPVMLWQMPWQAQLYQAAYEQARAAAEAESARPTFKMCWN